MAISRRIFTGGVAAGALTMSTRRPARAQTARFVFKCGSDVPLTHSLNIRMKEAADRIKDGDIALIFNTTEGWQSLKDSQPIRASALTQKIPYFPTASASVEAARAILALATRDLEVKPLQSYYSPSHN